MAGDGIVGLATALACAERGMSVRVIGRRLPGAASPAAAGLLAPSLGAVAAEVRRLMIAARDEWPGYAARLRRDTNVEVVVNALGIVEVASDEAERARLFAGAPPWARPLDGPELARLEPALSGAAGALLHPDDGAVDTVAVMRALEAACARTRGVARIEGLARSVSLGGEGVRLTTDDGSRHSGDVIVIASGAWASAIVGLPRELPVIPWRGQILALDAVTTARCVAGAGGYLVPRGGRTLVGSTMEQVGFDPATTDEGIGALRRTASALVPPLAAAPEAERWAGLRPMTPDLLPIVGPDPGEPRVVYGCGLSKNGILVAPLVAEAIAAACAGHPGAQDLRPFSIARFAGPVS